MNVAAVGKEQKLHGGNPRSLQLRRLRKLRALGSHYRGRDGRFLAPRHSRQKLLQ